MATKPFQQIRKDIKALAQMVIDSGQFVPESVLQVQQERRVKHICDNYYSKKREYPQFRAIKH